MKKLELKLAKTLQVLVTRVNVEALTSKHIEVKWALELRDHREENHQRRIIKLATRQENRNIHEATYYVVCKRPLKPTGSSRPGYRRVGCIHTPGDVGYRDQTGNDGVAAHHGSVGQR